MLRQAKIFLAAPLLGILLISSSFSLANQVSRPIGAALAPTKLLRQAELLVSKDPEEASDILSSYSANSLLESAWVDYLKGLIFFNEGNTSAAVTALTRPYAQYKENPGTEPDPALTRLIAMCIKKIAGYYQNSREYDRAYAYHQQAYEYFLKWGSAEEIHDATLSLDSDAYALGDFHLDEIWVRRGLEVAKEINGESPRLLALAKSWTNLAGTLSKLNRYGEAVQAVARTIPIWERLEKLGNENVIRLVWAHFGVGNVYVQWAKHLKALNDGHYREKLSKAATAYDEAVKLAELRNLPQAQVLEIQNKLKAVREAIH